MLILTRLLFLNSRPLVAGACNLLLVFGLTLPAIGAASPLTVSTQGDPIYIKAEQLLIQGKPDAAKALFEALQKKQPKNWLPMVAWAKVTARQAQYPQAEAMLLKALKLAPYSPEILAELALLYHNWSFTSIYGRQNPEVVSKVKDYFNLAQQQDAYHPVVLAYQARVALDYDDNAYAQKALQALMQQYPDYVEGLKQEARYYINLGETNRAREALQRALEQAPKDAEIYYISATLFKALDLPDEAIQQAYRSQEVDYVVVPDVLKLLATEHERLGALEMAEKYYLEYLRYVPNDPDMLTRLANLQQQAGNLAEAQQAFGEAAQLNPDILEGKLTDAMRLAQAGQLEEAIAAYQAIVTLKPDSMEALAHLSTLHYQRLLEGRFNPALAQQTQAAFERLRQLQALEANLGPAKNLSGIDPDRIALAETLLQWTLAGGPSPTIDARLNELCVASANALARGQACFLLGRLSEAQKQLDAYDGETATGYLHAAEQLRRLKAYEGSRQMYQRGLRQAALNGFTVGLTMVEAQAKASDRLLEDGNQRFDAKRYAEALASYQQALVAYPENVSAYLRVADAADKLRQWPLALRALKQALALQPGLLDSEAIQKQNRRLEKKQARAISASNTKASSLSWWDKVFNFFRGGGQSASVSSPSTTGTSSSNGTRYIPGLPIP